jgi:hypothetical protein
MNFTIYILRKVAEKGPFLQGSTYRATAGCSIFEQNGQRGGYDENTQAERP